MRIELPVAWVIVLNVAGWPVIQLILAWAFTRMPASWFRAPAAASWENGGRIYERWFAIRQWKEILPDAAPWFTGGFAKRTLVRTDPGYMRQFMQETWRGELCHWCALSCLPVFFLWNPLWADLVMAIYAVVANLPCILAQRYNRARLEKLLARRRAVAE